VRRLLATVTVLAAGATLLGSAAPALGQDSPSAKATRKRLLQVIPVVDLKDTRLADALKEITGDLDKKVNIKIHNPSGVSNNTKVTYKAKNETLEKVLDAICTQIDAGYIVVSDPKDRLDGFVVIRKGKGKERGYEFGKEPKDKSSRLQPRPAEGRPTPPALLRLGPAAAPAAALARLTRD
jgi:hypothetical protein